MVMETTIEIMESKIYQNIKDSSKGMPNWVRILIANYNSENVDQWKR